MPVTRLTVQVHHSHDFDPAWFRLVIHKSVGELPQKLASERCYENPPGFGMQENVILGGFDSLLEFTPEFLVATAVIPRGIYKLHLASTV
jgi:hypothetical protein